jgi:hypothetical protein
MQQKNSDSQDRSPEPSMPCISEGVWANHAVLDKKTSKGNKVPLDAG